MSYKRIFAALLSGAISFSPLASLANEAPPNHDQMVTLQYLVGTWHCTWQSGGKSGSLDQVFAPALDGAWLEEKEIVNVGGRATVTSVHYTGYDPRLKKYVHVGPDADGSYEVAQSPDGDEWSNADGTFVHHKISNDRRTMTDNARVNGKLVQSSMTCTRAN